jgi:hypothetical protein
VRPRIRKIGPTLGLDAKMARPEMGLIGFDDDAVVCSEQKNKLAAMGAGKG